MHRIAVLDDYQSVAADFADWSRVPEPVDVVEFHDHLADEDALVARLRALRRRRRHARAHARSRASLLERLPNLKLLVTTGRRNKSIDVEAADRARHHRLRHGRSCRTAPPSSPGG